MSDYQTTKGATFGIYSRKSYGPARGSTFGVYQRKSYGPSQAAEVGVDSRNTTYIRITSAVQRPISNIVDVYGKVYDDQAMGITLKKVQWSLSESGPWTDGDILVLDPAYTWPAAGSPTGSNYRVPLDIIGAPTGALWFRIEMDYDSTTTDHVAGTFDFTAYAPVPTLPDFLVVPEESHTGDYRVYWGGGFLTDYYEVEEATNEDFEDAVQVYSGTEIELDVEGKADGTYYYRVRGVNQYNVGPWLEGDNPVEVLPPVVPSVVSVPPESSTGAFRITWTPSEGAEWYELQEARSNAFSNPTTLYHGPDVFFDVYGRTNGRYYYRVRAGRG